MREHIQENDIIVTNNEHLAWTVLKFYFPDHLIKKDKNLNLTEQENVIWYFEDKNNSIDKEKIKQEGYEIENLYSGDIDSRYYFNILKLKKIT